MDRDQALREQLARYQDWQEAHAGFDAAIDRLPEALRGKKPRGFPHSAWELLEHIRRTQQDILDFCRNPGYQEKRWPEDYWPAEAAPPTRTAWKRSIDAFRADREAMKQLALDPAIDLFARVPHGSGQTYLRELLLVADHTAYHVGELVELRRVLGAWKAR